MGNVEQERNSKFIVKLKKTKVETLNMLRDVCVWRRGQNYFTLKRRN
jgi:hypothetical protein